MTNCPNNILEARKSSEKSQKEVAAALNVSAPTVSDWEREKKYPTVENLKQLADLFSVSTDYLLRRTNTPACIKPDEPLDCASRNEQYLIEMFRSMNNKGRQKFIDYLDDLVKNENNLLSSAPYRKVGRVIHVDFCRK